MNAMMNTEVAVNRVGIINTPNQPMYKRFSVDVTHSQKRPQRVALSRLSKVAVIVLKLKKKIKNSSLLMKQIIGKVTFSITWEESKKESTFKTSF
jgi:hypothetical protein